MKKKRRQRVLSILMALLMIVGLIPTDFAVFTAKAATTTTHTFDATSISGTGVTDKAAIAEGTTFDNGYFKVIGTVTQRISSTTGATTSIELGKALSGALQFSISQTADATIMMSSTGSSNVSPVALIDADGKVIANAEALTTVSTTTATTLTYNDLPAGTYRIVSPEDLALNRGARVLSAKVVEDDPAPVVETFKFDPTTISAAGVVDKAVIAEGTTFANYFKVVGAVTQRISSTTGSTTSIELGKALSGSLQFTVSGTADVKIDMSSTGSSNVSPVGLIDADGKLISNAENITTVSTTAATTLTYNGLAAGTYRIVSPEDLALNRGARVLSVTAVQTSTGVKPARKAWADVAVPAIGTITSANGTITVPFTMVIGYDGADSVAVTMKDSTGATVATKSAATEGTSGSVAFTPSASGNYTFSISALRASETDKVGADATFTGFSLPLTIPSISSATSLGGGVVSLVWGAVDEATGYQVSYSTDGTNYSQPISVTGTTTSISGLSVGTNYTFKVVATRGADVSPSDSIQATATQDAQRVWSYSAFGQGVDTDNNGFSGSVNTNDLKLWSVGGKGKIVPASTDGLSYYYTKISPSINFTLSANVTVNSWTFSNGQEGFGLMAADAVGTNRNSSIFWNNSYMASVTKVDYSYDLATGQVYDTINAGGSLGGDTKVTMKLGVGAQEKKGATAENIAAGTITAAEQKMSTLETSAIEKGVTSGNLVGNYTNSGNVNDNYNMGLTTFKLTITRNNSGYFISYTDQNGNTKTKKYYDYDRTALTQIDKDNIYVGFFASRNANISVSDVSLTTINPSDDAPAEVPETTYVTPTYTVISPSATGIADYDFSFVSNADGILTVSDPSGNVIINSQSVKTGETVTAPTLALNKGANDFTVTFDPNDDYIPGDYMLLSSYEPTTFTHTVNYKTYGLPGQSIWVSPTGTSKSSGNINDPMDIYTAVKYVQPGQTIVIKEGTYNLESTVKVARGIDGTAENPITMIADPSAANRPVFDFGGYCAGMIFAGDYWYFKGFDVTNSQNAQKGIQLSGNNCTIDQVNTYNNGSTGLQISRLLTTDLYKDWPANNLILNCTSYSNVDKGYEDADGFAAKLTVGDGNIFRGCISHNNADDGWDLFAKSETGPIGNVVIDNCVAYSNGYLMDGTVAGNGNGFKLGGSGISGKHELRNSIAYNNKAKGIDSNNGPDIIVVNSISFNNGSYNKDGKRDGGNVSLRTSYSANTDYSATGIISFRTENLEFNEDIALLGTQDPTKVYGETNYYWDGVSKSVNSLGSVVSADWFTSLDTSIAPTRDDDGSINMHGLLALTDKAPANIGARFVSTPSKIIVIPASVPAPKTGDMTHVYLFFTLSVMSGAALVGLYYYDRKRKNIVKR